MIHFLFLLSFFLIRIPSFYIIPFISNPVLTTQGISRIILFVTVSIVLIKQGKKFYLSLNDCLVLGLFMFQSVSIIMASDTLAYLERYKDLVLVYMLFFTLKLINFSHKKVFQIIVITSVINILYGLLIIYFPFSRSFFQSITYQRYFDLVIADIERGRYYSTSYDETVLPILLNFGNIYISIATIFITFVSNFRTKILSLLFVMISYVLLSKKNKILISCVLIIIPIIASIYTINQESFIERFNIQDQVQTQTISSRLKQISLGIELGDSTFGIGLGNYYNYVSESSKNNRSSLFSNKTHLREVNDAIHNNIVSILAESGLISMILYIILIFSFLSQDLIYIIKTGVRKNVPSTVLLILSFWGLFIYGFLNPGVALSYQYQFWFYRGLIQYEYRH